MKNDFFNGGLIRASARLCESVVLEPLRSGESCFELRIDVYEHSFGVYTTEVLSKEAFLWQHALLSASDPELTKGVYKVYVPDLHYDTSLVREQTAIAAFQSTVKLIQEKLAAWGLQIEPASQPDSPSHSENPLV